MLTALAAILVIASQAPAQKCESVKGTFVAHIVKDGCSAALCTAGDLTGGLKGHYKFQTVGDPKPAGGPAPASVIFFVGESSVTPDKGGTLGGIDTGTIDMPPGLGGFASLITWNGGATGQIRLRGVLDPAAGTTSGDYEGTVCGRSKQ